MRHLVLLLSCLLLALPAQATRIKDITSVSGVRSNQLIGYGLVVGLEGTGDQTTQTPFTIQSIKSMLTNLGVNVPEGVNAQLKNVAAVMVHAELPPFAKPGQTIDVTVSSLGNADSLRGGTLLMTPLKAVDGEIYALAQGSLLVSGFGAEGADGSRVTVNVQSAGRIPNGATVERTVPSTFAEAPSLMFNLNAPDFTTAQRVATTINTHLGPGTAAPVDATSVEVSAPAGRAERIAFLSIVENLQVSPDAAPARVVVNSRSGTIVIGNEVRVERAAVAHGNLVVTVSEDFEVSQPAPFTRSPGAATAVVPDSEVTVETEDARMFLLEPGVTLQELVTAVNNVGAAPGDLIAILEALQQAGALRAQLIVI